MQVAEKLFKDAAGSNEEIDWMELKAILDGSIPQGKYMFVTVHKIVTNKTNF